MITKKILLISIIVLLLITLIIVIDKHKNSIMNYLEKIDTTEKILYVEEQKNSAFIFLEDINNIDVEIRFMKKTLLSWEKVGNSYLAIKSREYKDW